MPYAESAGARIYWEERGRGEPVLFIMGIGFSLDMWARVVRWVEPEFRCILFDNRGAGRSDAPWRPYSIRGMARDAVARLENVSVESFSGLTVDFARDEQADVIVRGLRAVSDFEYEFKLAHMNHHLAPEIEVVCLMTSSRNSFVSSSMIREVASLGGDVAGLVPPNVEAILRERFGVIAAGRTGS